MSFCDILDQLRTTTGSNDKISILSENIDNHCLREYLKFSLDNSITFGVKEFKYTPGVGNMDDSNAFVQFEILALALSTRALTGNAALESIRETFLQFTATQCLWFERCIKKDLSIIGIGRSIVEKVWPNLTGKFRVNLAAEEKEIGKFDWSDGASIEVKLNGVRTLVEVDNGEITWVKGRSGLELPNFYLIVSGIVKALLPTDKYIFDGEVHCKNSLENTMTVCSFDFNKSREDFKTEKAYRKWYDEKFSIAVALLNDCTYDIFDIIPIDEFNNLECSRTYLERRVLLENLRQSLIENNISIIRVVDSFPVADKDEAVSIANQYMVLGLEGAILKANGAKYEYKRARNFIKIKECTGEFEAQIIGIEIAKDIYNTDGTLGLPQAGCVMLRYINDIGTYSESGCGTGEWLTKAKKEEMAANPELFINKIVTAEGQRFSEDHIILVPRIKYERPDRLTLEE